VLGGAPRHAPPDDQATSPGGPPNASVTAGVHYPRGAGANAEKKEACTPKLIA